MSEFLSTPQLLLVLVAAVVGFWIVGAYNRLVRLRTAIHEAFNAVDAQIRQRHQLLEAWTTTLRDVFDDSAQIDAVERAAVELLQQAEKTRKRASSAAAVGNLGVAETSLAAARTQLTAERPAHVHQPTLSEAAGELSGIGDRMLAVDSTLAFARQQFNAAAEVYNAALHQFPTTLIAGLFGFQPAGTW